MRDFLLVWWLALYAVFNLAQDFDEGFFEDASDEEALEESIV